MSLTVQSTQEIQTESNITSNEPRPAQPTIDYKKVLHECGTAEYIEVTLNIGCPVQCSRFCPQEVLTQKYTSKERIMTFETFKQILPKIPKRVQLNFAGFCEPFTNPDFIRILEFAASFGYKLQLFTTLHGATANDVERLVKIQFNSFALHLRDGTSVKFKATQEYKDNVFRVLEAIPNVSLCLMNELFQTNNRENVARGILPSPKTVGYCRKLETPQFVLLPNGDLTLCCMDFGLEHKVGNILDETYLTIRRRFLANKKAPKLCSYCSASISQKQNMYNNIVQKTKSIGRKALPSLL
jgi:hypothetical protein